MGKKQTKKEIKAIEDRVSAAYSRSCHGVQVNIMQLPKIMAVGKESVAAGDDDAALEKKIREYVDTIRAA